MARDTKWKLDDYLEAGGNAEDLEAACTDVPTFIGSDPERPERTYEETPSGIVWWKPHHDGPIPTPLTNFCVRIVAQVLEEVAFEEGQADVVDVAPRRLLDLEVTHGGKSKRFLVPSENFSSMGWVMRYVGSTALIFPIPNGREHVAAAIQALSPHPEERWIYVRTGWHKIPDGTWAYVHGGGAVGASVLENVSVHLPPALKPFCLPPPPSGEELRQAVLESMNLVNLAPLHIMLPLVAAIYRSVLAPSDFAVFLVGQTGVFKTQIAALLQSHLGSGFDASRLPANFSSTPNALEALAHAAKDAPLATDDYAPYGSPKEVQAMEAKAERLLRAQGNNSGRQRQAADLRLRPAMPPSGLIIGTGEDAPRGHSIHARILTLSLAPGDVNPGFLTQCQDLARQGVFAQATAGFLRWVAPQYEVISRGLDENVRSWRTHFISSGQHARAAQNAAHLMLGWSQFIDFGIESGALSSKEKEFWIKEGIKAIRRATLLHTLDQDVAEPTTRFVEILRSALGTDKAYLASPSGSEPCNPEAWGWRLRNPGLEGNYREWQPQGRKIGWIVGEDVYLDLVAAIAVVNAHRDGNDLRLSAKTLSKRLHEKGLLASTEPKRETLLVRRRLEGRRQDVLHLNASLFGAEKPDQPDQGEHEDALISRRTCSGLLRATFLQENYGQSESLRDDQLDQSAKPKRSKPPEGYGLH